MKTAPVMFSSVLVGLAAALAAGALAVLAALALGFARVWWDFADGTGEMGAFGVDVPALSLVATAIGFVLGFFWRYRHIPRR